MSRLCIKGKKVKMTPLKKLERRWLLYLRCVVWRAQMLQTGGLFIHCGSGTGLIADWLLYSEAFYLPIVFLICSLCSSSYYFFQLGLNLPLWKTDVYLTHLCVNPSSKKMKSNPTWYFFRVRNHAVQLPNPQLCADWTQEVLKHDITVMKRASAFIVQKPKVNWGLGFSLACFLKVLVSNRPLACC